MTARRRRFLLPSIEGQPKRTEHDEQAVVIAWARLNESRYPVLRWLYAIPNGGHRHIAIAKRMRAEGVKRGVSDLCLPAPRGQYHGLYLEMKTEQGEHTPEQREFLKFATAQGYYAHTCRSADEAIWHLEFYLNLGG